MQVSGRQAGAVESRQLPLPWVLPAMKNAAGTPA
jgi:hypothetical protein